MNVHLPLAAAALAAALSLSAAALAEMPIHDQPALAIVPARRSSVQVDLELGVRGMILPHAGLDPYATSDALGMFSLAGGATLLREGRVSFAALAEWDTGSFDNPARADAASLTMHRLGVDLITRYDLSRYFSLFLKLAPAGVNLRASIQDASIPRPLLANTWTWGFDAAAGASLVFATIGPSAAPYARFLFTGDLGYSFAGTAPMVFSVSADDKDPRRYGSITLPSLSPAGGVGRLGIGLSF